MRRYWTNIVASVATIFEGLAITVSHLLRRPITIQYPDRMETPLKETLSTRYRGFLNVDMKICTACTLCKVACPIQCIDLGVDSRTSDDSEAGAPVKKERVISRFDIDIGKCMFCGLCVEACPTGAIHFTRGFEKATRSLPDLTFRFVDAERPVVPYKRGGAL